MMAATMTWGMAIVATTAWGVVPTVTVPPAVQSPVPPALLKKSHKNLAISGPPPPLPYDFQKPEIVAITPAEAAAIFANEMAEWLPGETFTWAEIQIQYRRLARDKGWRMEIADRILSKALKNAKCTRGQLDLRSEGKGRPITITFPIDEAGS